MGKPNTATAPKAPKTEAEKAAAFISIGTKRVNAAINAISRLSSLANKRQYAYNGEQVAAIGKAFAQAWETVSKAFAGEKKPGGFKF